MAASQEKKAVYFGSLTVEGVKCFKGKENTLKLTDAEGKPSMMNVILGNNGAGKTTLLTCLLGMMPVEIEMKSEHDPKLAVPTVVPFRIVSENFPKFGGNIECEFSLEGYLHGGFKHQNYGWRVREKGWDVSPIDQGKEKPILDLTLLAYGAKRRIGSNGLSEESTTNSSFFQDDKLINAEEYLVRLDYAGGKGQENAARNFLRIQQLLLSFIPEIRNLRASSNEQLQNQILVETDAATIPLRELSLGFQTMLALIVDIAKSMLGNYSDSETPFQEPAVILIDEIDLHLHPTWQQRILQDLRMHFPNVQFIVTTHSPLVLQNASNYNLAILDQGEDGVTIRNIQGANLQGWAVEEILEDVMGVKEATSQANIDANRAFERALGEKNYDAAIEAYDRLKAMLPRDSVKPEVMKLRLAGLRPKTAI
jgi:energy-coupling factor transporter ATP-binding protein EcfA2